MTRLKGFTAADKLQWLNIRDEQQRTYHWGDGRQVTVPNPERVSIKVKTIGDSHRIITKGDSFYIPAGWCAISWTPKKGRAPYAW